jgi:hypothetical protein
MRRCGQPCGVADPLAVAARWEATRRLPDYSMPLTVDDLPALPTSVISLTLVVGCGGSMMGHGQPSGVLHP